MLNNVLNMSRKEIIEKIKENGFFIENIEDPDEELQLLAIENNAFCIRKISNPTEKVQIQAVDSFISCFKYIKRPCQDVIDRVHGLYPTPRCISPESFKYKFYECVYKTMDEIKYDFDCFISEKDTFFKYKTLGLAMSYLKKKGSGPWNLNNHKGPSQLDIRKIDFSNLGEGSKGIIDYLEFTGKTEFQHGEEIEMWDVLPSLFGADECPDGHADYLVFEYKDELYLLTLLCFE